MTTTNETTYAAMLLSDYNSTCHMDQIERCESRWSTYEQARREHEHYTGIPLVIVERRKIGNEYRYQLVNNNLAPLG
jgi:hypothetical protein